MKNVRFKIPDYGRQVGRVLLTNRQPYPTRWIGQRRPPHISSDITTRNRFLADNRTHKVFAFYIQVRVHS